MAGGFTGISLAGRWECGKCGASGDGWWNDEDGVTLEDAEGNAFALHEHVCEE